MQKWEYAVIRFDTGGISYYRSNLFTEDQLKEIDQHGTLEKDKKRRIMHFSHKLRYREVGVQQMLHVLGRDGWEAVVPLVYTKYTNRGTDDTPPILIFKRPLED